MDTESTGTKDIVFVVRRYNPETDGAPHNKEYTVRVEPGMTVLDGLHEIKNYQDSTLAWRFSCRMGVCGSCAMLINGKAMLACNTQILHLTDRVLTVGPLPNFDIVRDLVPDLQPMFEKHISGLPHIKREDQDPKATPTDEYYQTPEELTRFLQFSYCIKCGACMAACPTLATDKNYLGPMPLTQFHRYNVDTRDAGFDDRKKIAGGQAGVARCHYAGECSNVCPKGVDPARAIQLMKRDLVFGYLGLKRRKGACGTIGPDSKGTRKEGVPDPPPYTIDQK